MKCPKCGSKAYVEGCSHKTLMHCAPFTDENGDMHMHDSNVVTTRATCLNCREDYEFKHTPGCWCGWPDFKHAAECTNKECHREWNAAKVGEPCPECGSKSEPIVFDGVLQ